MKKIKGTFAGFAVYFVAHATHWYFVSEYSKFKRFDPLWSAMCAAMFTAAGVVVGLIFRQRQARAFWSRLGWWSLFLSATGVVLLVVDYKMKLEWSDAGDPYPPHWFTPIGLFLSGFPWLHLALRNEPNQSTTAQPASRVADC